MSKTFARAKTVAKNATGSGGGGGIIYPANLIPFGDGITAGGITASDFSWNETNQDFVVGNLVSSNSFLISNSLHLFALGRTISSNHFEGLTFFDTNSSGAGSEVISGLSLDLKNKLYILGDNAGTGNSTCFSINDTTQVYNFNKLTASQLLGTDSLKNLLSLTTVTYPSLTEISYVKGVTSSIQTQLGAKWDTSGNSGTTPGTNFLGTTDDKDLVFKRNNVLSGLLTETKNNTSFGVGALASLTIGTSNTALGTYALPNLTTGINNVAVGSTSLFSCTSGSTNVGVGAQALYSLTTGQANSALGAGSCYAITTGSNNVGIGFSSFSNITTGINNVGIGRASGLGCDTTSADCIGIGFGSIGGTVQIRSNNVGIGTYGLSSTYGNNLIGIGYRGGASYTSAPLNVSNSLYLGGGYASQSNEIVFGGRTYSSFYNSFYSNLYLNGRFGQVADLCPITIQPISVVDNAFAGYGFGTSVTDGAATGASLIFAGSQGTGTGTGGSLIFKTAPSGLTGNTNNSLVEAMSINGQGNVKISNKVQIADGSQGTIGYVWTSTDVNGNGHWAVSSGGSAWGLSGNSGTTSSNFIGTTDSQGFRIKQNSVTYGVFNDSITVAGYGTINGTGIGSVSILNNGSYGQFLGIDHSVFNVAIVERVAGQNQVGGVAQWYHSFCTASPSNTTTGSFGYWGAGGTPFGISGGTDGTNSSANGTYITWKDDIGGIDLIINPAASYTMVTSAIGEGLMIRGNFGGITSAFGLGVMDSTGVTTSKGMFSIPGLNSYILGEFNIGVSYWGLLIESSGISLGAVGRGNYTQLVVDDVNKKVSIYAAPTSTLSPLNIRFLPTYANDAAAGVGLLGAGDIYQVTGTHYLAVKQ